MPESNVADLSNGESGDTTHDVQSAVLASALQSLLVICGSVLTEEDTAQLALDALLDAHRPALGKSS